MAWQEILGTQGVRSALVVAHNAVNQALLNTALGLPPTFFRRLLQTNAATSVIDFQPNGDGPPICTIDRMNQVGTCSATLSGNIQTYLYQPSLLAVPFGRW